MLEQTGSSSTGPFRRATVACKSCRLRKVKCDALSTASDEGCGPCRRAGQECLLDPLSDGRRSVSRKFVDKLQQRIETLEALNQRPTVEIEWGRDDDGIDKGPDTTAEASQSNSAVENAASKFISNSHNALPMASLADENLPESTRDESPRFYGVTSHLHVVSPSEESTLVLSDDVDAIGIDLDPSSPHLRDNLLQSFFKYQTLWVDIVNKKSFLAHRVKGKSCEWYSRFLENSILACGTRLSTSKSVRDLGPKYFDLAMNEALGAMSAPTPANLQGFLALSEYEVTKGNNRSGWMFCGVACRMVSDLGLHELASVNINHGSTQVSREESALAYALLSACIAYEGVWSLYLGRPSSIPEPAMGIAALRCKENRDSDSPLLNAWVGLCIPMAEISHVLNAKSILDSDRTASLRRLFEQVEEWYKSLPQQLAFNERSLTNMDLAGYGLHTQYCKVQILLRRCLNRPQSSRKRRYSQMESDDSSNPSSHDTNKAIYEYALRTSRLVVTYREAFGMENIPSIMLDNSVVAATVMIQHFNKSDEAEEPHQTIWLRHLVKSMKSVQPHFPIIGRMLISLEKICESDLLRSIIPTSRQNSIDSPSRNVMTQSKSIDLTSKPSTDQGSFLESINVSDINWDCFEAEIPADIFSSSGLDSVLGFPSSDQLTSSLAQAVP